MGGIQVVKEQTLITLTLHLQKLGRLKGQGGRVKGRTGAPVLASSYRGSTQELLSHVKGLRTECFKHIFKIAKVTNITSIYNCQK